MISRHLSKAQTKEEWKIKIFSPVIGLKEGAFILSNVI